MGYCSDEPIHWVDTTADLKAEMRAETMVDSKANIGEKHIEKSESVLRIILAMSQNQIILSFQKHSFTLELGWDEVDGRLEG